MAIANYTDWLNSLKIKPTFSFTGGTGLGSTTGSPLFGGWRDPYTAMLPSLTVPTTPTTCDRTTSGSFGQTNTSSGSNYLIGMTARASSVSALLLVDRLSHQAGLSGIVTTTQTTNLPTAALTRYTSGEGVFIGISVYSALGSTAADLQVSYTNSLGVSGRTSNYTNYTGATSYFSRGNGFVIMPLQSGDTGVRSVESVFLSASSGTAGNFGITLFKPLALLPYIGADVAISNFIDGNFIGGIPAILNDACLWPIFWNQTLVSTISPAATITLTES